MAEEKKEEKASKAEEKKEVEVPKELKDIVEKIGEMSVLELSKLVKVLEEKFGVSAKAMAPVMMAGPAGQAGAPAEEAKAAYNVYLKAVGDKKIEVIKAIRDITGKGLKDSKDLVDAAEKEVQLVKENVKKEEADQMQEKFSAAGATIELK